MAPAVSAPVSATKVRREPAGAVAPRGRLAPSPTGLVHLGNARTALAAWLSVRSRGGRLVWRLEDLDQPRMVAGMAEAAQRDLAWLGLDWDEGTGRGGPFAPYAQSERGKIYQRALSELQEKGRLFPCTLSRRDLEDLASAPHVRARENAYPANLRPQAVDEPWLTDLLAGKRSDAAIRFLVEPGVVTFDDRVYGTVCESVEETVGDFVLRRRDGLIAYQLAVVVDDLDMHIDDVVRGADLLDSTPRQLQLIEALDGAPPRYAHIPLVRNAQGQKLSKRDQSLTLRSLESEGIAPEQIVGYLAHSLGLLETLQPCLPADLIERFEWRLIRREDLILPAGAADVLRAV
jgi:glutamyl-tRNA synthetase